MSYNGYKKGDKKMEKKKVLPADICRPVIEFAALLKFLRENGMVKEELRMRSMAPGLSMIHDKLCASFDENARQYFDQEVEKSYRQFLDDLDKKTGFKR